MKIKKFKKLTAFTIAVMLVLSMCVTGISASAATCVEETVSAVSEEVISAVEETTATEPVMTAPTEATFVTEPTEVEAVTEPAEVAAVNVEPAEEEYITVFFYNSFDQYYYGWDEVYAYYWDETEGDMIDAPGVQMSTYGEDEYTYIPEMVVSIPATAKNITFHDNNGHEIANIAVAGDGKIYKDGSWQDMKRIIGFDNRITDWENIYAYYWSETDNSMVQWPGVELSSDVEYNYSYIEWVSVAQIPLNATHLIFHNNEGSNTADLVIPNGVEMTFSSFANEWMTGLSEIQCATAEADVCMVAGDSKLCGSDWDGDLSTSYDNAMDKTGEPSYDCDEDSDYFYRYVGEYEKTYEDVQPATGLQFKIVSHFHNAGHSYIDSIVDTVNWYGNENGNRVTFNVTKTCDVKIKFNYSTKEITVTGDGVEMVDDIQIDSVYAAGNGKNNWLNDSVWEPTESSNKMTEIENNVYQITYEDVAAYDSYQVKFVANGTWSYNWGGIFEGSDVESEAVYCSDNNITFENPYEIADVTLTIDFNTYNPATMTGAKFNVYIDDKTTSKLYFVVPNTTNSPKCWNNGVYLAYSNDYTPSSFTKLALTKTEDALSPVLQTDSLIEGTYIAYSIDLTYEQIKTLNKASYVALMNSTNDYRTYASGKYNLLKAPVGEYSEEYNTTKTDVADLDGYTFIMNDQVETGTSIQGYATFTGYWKKVNFKEEQITIKAVLPASTIWENCWNNGVYLAYSDSYELDSFTKIEMTKTNDTFWPDVYTDYLVDEECYIYTVTLTGAQAVAIENAGYVVFMNASGDYRTYINKKYNILNASLWWVDYENVKSTIASRDDYLFVVCDSVATGTSIEGYGTFTGYWSDWY